MTRIVTFVVAAVVLLGGLCGLFPTDETGAAEKEDTTDVPRSLFGIGLTAPEPPPTGPGRRPRVPFTRADRWCVPPCRRRPGRPSRSAPQ